MSDTATKAPTKRYTGPVSLGDVEPEEVKSLRKGADLAPYIDLLTKSWNLREQEQNSVLGITIITASKTVVESRLRQAANEMGLGVSVGVKEQHPGLEVGQMRLLVQARPKRERKPVDPNAPKKVRKPKGGLPPVGGS